ncbi:MAG TPA: hypothetical protein ENJ33_02080 [Thiothrix sp.]|nr:hypothetical protein [Thiothrix sp.]
MCKTLELSKAVYQQAAELLWQDRASGYLRYPPGLAEYIDLLKALQTLTKKDQQQRLNIIANYALKKERVLLILNKKFTFYYF